jgi:hypothetical protein
LLYARKIRATSQSFVERDKRGGCGLLWELTMHRSPSVYIFGKPSNFAEGVSYRGFIESMDGAKHSCGLSRTPSPVSSIMNSVPGAQARESRMFFGNIS